MAISEGRENDRRGTDERKCRGTRSATEVRAVDGYSNETNANARTDMRGDKNLVYTMRGNLGGAGTWGEKIGIAHEQDGG